MNRAVYIGGFGNGKASAERVGEALGHYYADVDVFTFAEAMDKKSNQVRRASQGVSRLVTHSAGIMAITDEMSPGVISAFNAPLPTSRKHLMLATLKKTARMHANLMDASLIGTPEGSVGPVLAYDRSAVAELIANPIENLKYLKQIAQFDAIDCAATISSDIETELIYTTKDDYFNPNKQDLARALLSGVQLYMTDGQHDELVLQPETAIAYMRDTSREPLNIAA
jgi:hypothetical protein